MPQNHPTSSPPTKRISLTRPPRGNWMVSQPQPAPSRRLRSTLAEPPPDVSCVTAHVPILLFYVGIYFAQPQRATILPSSTSLGRAHARRHHRPGPFPKERSTSPVPPPKTSTRAAPYIPPTQPTRPPEKSRTRSAQGPSTRESARKPKTCPRRSPRTRLRTQARPAEKAGTRPCKMRSPKSPRKTRVRMFQRPPCALHALQPMPQC